LRSGARPRRRVPELPGESRLNGLIVGFIAGTIGVGYFIYGKKQQKLAPMLAGLLLCVYPYFTENIWVLLAVGAGLMAFPFFVEF
jgi:hypothetical protein